MPKKKPINTPDNYVYGRPTIYTEDTVKKVYDYLNNTGVTFNKDFKVNEVKLPSLAGLANYLGVVKRTILDWADKYDEFSHALDVVRQAQEESLLNNGLQGTYNSTISKLILSSNHGYQERKDITSAGKEMKSFNFQMNEPSDGHKVDSDKASG